MMKDVEAAVRAGAHGVVIGVRAEDVLDVRYTYRFVRSLTGFVSLA